MVQENSPGLTPEAGYEMLVRERERLIAAGQASIDEIDGWFNDSVEYLILLQTALDIIDQDDELPEPLDNNNDNNNNNNDNNNNDNNNDNNNNDNNNDNNNNDNNNNNSFNNITSPLDQFEIRNLLSLDAPIFGYVNLSLSSISLYLLVAGFITLTTNLL